MKIKQLFILSFIFFAFNQNAQNAASNFTLLSHINPNTIDSSFNGLKYSGCWGWYQASKNKEYAIVCSSPGTYFIDVTIPTSPTVCAYKAGNSTQTLNKEVKTYQNYAYVVCDSYSPNFLIYDLQYLPDSVVLVYESKALFEKAHTIFVDGNKLYACGVTYSNNVQSSMNVYSLATPTAPVLLRELKQDAPFVTYVHDVFVRNDTSYASATYGGVYVFKFDTISNVFFQLGSYSGQSSHSSWLTPNGQTLVHSWETSGYANQALNVSNLSNIPVTSNMLQFPQQTPHNPYIVNNQYVFISSYQDGLVAWDISNPTVPVLAGYFDTYPLSGGNVSNYDPFDFYGNWGAYPFFPSKNILTVDDRTGIFMLKTHLYQNPLPGFTLPSNVCVGSSFSIVNTSSASTSYTWSFPGGSPAISTATNPIISYPASGVYSITLTASNTSGTAITTQTINVINIVSSVTSTNSACSSCSTGIIIVTTTGGIGPFSYSWLPSVSTTSTASNLAPSCYSISITDSNACTNFTSTCVGFSTGLQNNESMHSNLLIYPNPAKNNVTIDAKGFIYNYAIYNSLGKLVSVAKNNQIITTINLSEFTKGIYLIEIEFEKNKVRKKIIIE